MILKGSQRANGSDLATHLMQALENESVDIAEITGTMATDLHGAFAEIEAIASGTKAQNYLYSLSINPPAPLTRDQYQQAIRHIEDGLGLTAQPRAIVFHVKPDKNGIAREHCHVVWSKIDAVSMKAIHMAYDHAKLCDLACELAREFGLELPPGLQEWEEQRRSEKDTLEATMTENAIAKETGITPEQRQDDVTAAYTLTDTAAAFQTALLEAGYILAQGDRRGFVVLDAFGKVHSLTRYVEGVRAKEIKHRLSGISALPTVDEAKGELAAHRQAVQDRHREQARQQAMEALKRAHTARRVPLEAKEQQILVTHAGERMALHAAQRAEGVKVTIEHPTHTETFLRRIKNAVLALLRRTPGLWSVLAHITRNAELDISQRHALENQALQARHVRELAMIEREKRSMEAVENRELKTLEKTIRRKLSESETRSRSYDQAIHESEDLHRIHSDLLEHRRYLEEVQGLSVTFNIKANPRKKKRQGDSSRTIKPIILRHDRRSDH